MENDTFSKTFYFLDNIYEKTFTNYRTIKMNIGAETCFFILIQHRRPNSYIECNRTPYIQ